MMDSYIRRCFTDANVQSQVQPRLQWSSSNISRYGKKHHGRLIGLLGEWLINVAYLFHLIAIHYIYTYNNV